MHGSIVQQLARPPGKQVQGAIPRETTYLAACYSR